MASANLSLVRSIYAAWERGDFSSAEWADPEIEYLVADGPLPGSWTGLSATAEASRDWLSAWEGTPRRGGRVSRARRRASARA